MLTIWGRRNSYNVQKVLWLADELNIDYRHRLAGGETGGLDAESFLSMNPNGRIPVLEDGDLVVWETDAILRYLSSAYASRAFSPRSAAAQSHIDRWMAWASTSLEPAFFTGVFWGFYRTPVERHDAEAITRALEKCARLYSILDAQLSKAPYLSGEALGLADIPAGTTLYRYFELDIPRPSLPNVEAWYERLMDRPAYRCNVMRPFEELYGRLAY
ncbi:glutathione S-transferase family protein [Salinicola rhizosphaerae]|uniref:Glutathione S-transferase n=1 Tax=Salinicola rhizosphaerae TaxID=1443141 RepID=A0ABQ3E3B3_9GAMM|nr:glutathione S-transferase [Salinicola rhizosphaerae]GHB22056.1 glutathione S-transferase [Salinicola rhizosphaerae]